ncbi:MAG: MBL fold metallo-hydrolase [Clostridia bacterium]|nr:MBL fold metallo-hydrolase [Clostridia bacterium]
MLKRSTALLIALLAVMLLTACGGSAAQTDTTTDLTSADTPETTAPAEELAIIENGAANYRIIRHEEASSAAVKAATRVRELIGQETGVYPDLSTDWHRKDADLDHTTLEILVGATDYTESASALAGILYGDYIVTRVDNKLVINAWCDAGLEAAVTALGRELFNRAEAGSFTLPADIRLTGTKVDIVNALPVYDGGNVRAIYDAGNQNQVLIVDDTTPDEYAAYRRAIETAGYTLYTENAIADNRFATYVSDQYVINAGYYAYETASRIIIEPRTTLPALEDENKYESKIQPSFAMLGLEHDSNGVLVQNGLCFIFQLADGSYIVVDGGFPRQRDAKAIYDYLYAHAPDPNDITVAGWFITHAHSDHYAAYNLFSQTYADKVKVEYVIGNFPSDTARIEGGLGTEGSVGPQIEQNVARFEGAQFIKAHTGYQFFMRDARIEVLYTLESYAPGVLSYFNTTSLIFTVEIAGQKFNILGDASNDACNIAYKMYGDTLKSDFVQTAHHGYTTGSTAYGGVTAVYSASAAPVVLWPVGEKDYAGMSSRAYDAHLQELAATKEIFVAGSREVRFMLPYAAGTSGYASILK